MVTRAELREHVVPGQRLGRHVEHDDRSRAFAFLAARQVVPLRSVSWPRYGEVLDQGNLGSCTGNAAAGALNTKPVHRKGRIFHEPDAVDFYSAATALDEWDGGYPPDDTGSSGLAVAKALLQRGLIRAYQHAFGIDETLQALMHGPVITGVNWHEGFDRPDSRGRVVVEGDVRGGHEFEVLGLRLARNVDESYVVAVNSWGRGWGDRGRFYFTVADWRSLLAEQGDVTIPLP